MQLKQLLPQIILFSLLIFLVFTAFRGLAFPDEGYILNTGQRLLSGEILYRDFDFVYTPLTAVLTFFSFKLFGISIFSERLLNLLISATTGYFLLRFGRQITKNNLFQLLPLSLYVAWGPSHINFLWPGMLAVNLALIAHCLFFDGQQTRNHTSFFFAGLFLSLVILTKPNYAAAIVGEVCLLFFCIKEFRQKNTFLPFFLGMSVPLGIFFISLLLTQSLTAFWHNFYLNIIEQIVIKGSITTSLPLGNNLLSSFSKLLFYFSPFLLSLLATSIVWKKEKRFLPFLFLVILFFLAGFRPVSDYVHLSPLLALDGIPLIILLPSLLKPKTPLPHVLRHNKKIVLILLTTCYLLLTTVGVWSSLFFGYYRWSPPLISRSTLSKNPRVKIWVDSQTEQKIDTITSLVNTYTSPGENVFLNYYAPMIYFLTSRQNPTRYDYTGLPPEYQKSITQTLEQKKIQVVITFSLNSHDSSVIGKYIHQRFRIVTQKDEYTVWRRKTS